MIRDSYKPDYGGQIHELPEHPEYGLTFVVCSNAEALGLHDDNTGCMTVDEAVSRCRRAGGASSTPATTDEDAVFNTGTAAGGCNSAITTGDITAYVWLREQDPAGEWGD